MFSDQKPIGEDSGLALAEWARGGAAAPTVAQFKPTEPMPDDKTAAEWDIELGEAAKKGMAALQAFWSTIPREHQTTLKAALDRRHKPTAEHVDRRTV